jgi:hypothetical protein
VCLPRSGNCAAAGQTHRSAPTQSTSWCDRHIATYNLKRVYLEGENLYVANYLKWVRISLTEVDGIGASWWNGERGKQPRITLTLKASSEFGDRIVFSPRGLRLKKAADELRQLIEERTNRQIASWQNE